MSHSPLFAHLHRRLHATILATAGRFPAIQPVAGSTAAAPSRRQFLASAGASLAAARAVLAKKAPPNISVGVAGTGLAGLACAYELRRQGVDVTLYDASDRAGGRCWSLRGHFPGQTAERGGELIDNLHKTMLGYAREFGLGLEDLSKQTGHETFYFDGRHVAESEVVAEFRDFVPAMRADLRRISKHPSAARFTPADRELDLISLKQYLETRGVGRIACKAIELAYLAEYGLEIEEQSCLNFLLFMHADRRSRFQPFGVFSDERYHLVDGNDAIAQGLVERIGAERFVPGVWLQRVARTAAGRIELTLQKGASTAVQTHDAVVLAIPFSVLRRIELDASLDLPAAKTEAIQQLGYGTNAKLMLGFTRRTWRDSGGNGGTYADLANCQTTWETNPALASSHNAVLTSYTGGNLGAVLNQSGEQAAAGSFLGDLSQVFPGAASDAALVGGQFLAHLEHWPSNPRSLGSYTCYRPGQFTTIAGHEGTPAGNLFFAGEHTNSFYEWQGFMEGALLSGLQAARDILTSGK
jgi:monoamine oxidase